MKLYYSKGACSLASHIVINELGLTCEYVPVDLKLHETGLGIDYYQINPKGAVPALETHTGEILTENSVILQYLADSADNTTLLPEVGNFKRYRILEWLNFAASDLHKGIGILFNPNFPDKVKDDILVPNIKKKIIPVNKQLENHLFIAGDEFTLPDAYLFVMINWLRHFKFDLHQWPNVSRYFEELYKRKSVHLSLKEEGLS